MVRENMDSIKHLSHFAGTFVTIFLLTSGAVTTVQATEITVVESTVENSQIPANCSRLYAAVKERPFNIPPGSWFWKEARSYLASLGLPHDSHHVKMFEEAFEAVYSKIGDENFDHSAAYDMTPIFQKAGLGDVVFDYCSRD